MSLPSPISRASFERWAQVAFGETKSPSIRKIAKIGGISKSRLSYQLNADTVDPRIIIAISRGLSLNPKEQLSLFTGYEQLVKPPAIPTAEEILALVSFRDLLTAITHRLGIHTIPKDLDMPPSSSTWSSWFKAAASGITYAQIREATGLSQTMISKYQQSAGWGIEEIIQISQAFGLNLHMALVAAGDLTLNESGLPPLLREKILKSASDETLQDQLEKRASSLVQIIRNQNEEDLENELRERMG